jgi:hypothetical protein
MVPARKTGPPKELKKLHRCRVLARKIGHSKEQLHFIVAGLSKQSKGIVALRMHCCQDLERKNNSVMQNNKYAALLRGPSKILPFRPSKILSQNSLF